MLVYKLDKQIHSEKLINDINILLSKHQNNLENKLLYISIKTIINDNDSPIPKLDHKILPNQ